MPVWAYLYCALIVLAGAATIYLNSEEAKYYIPGEILSVIFCLSFFFFYYGVIPKPSNIAIPLLFLVYIVYWEAWENRHHYSLEYFTDEDEELDDEAKQYIFKFMLIFILLFIAPFLYVVCSFLFSYFI